jgi:hypothetical protein
MLSNALIGLITRTLHCIPEMARKPSTLETTQAPSGEPPRSRRTHYSANLIYQAHLRRSAPINLKRRLLRGINNLSILPTNSRASAWLRYLCRDRRASPSKITSSHTLNSIPVQPRPNRFIRRNSIGAY